MNLYFFVQGYAFLSKIQIYHSILLVYLFFMGCCTSYYNIPTTLCFAVKPLLAMLRTNGAHLNDFGVVLFDVLAQIVRGVEQICLACKTVYPPTMVGLPALMLGRMFVVTDCERRLNSRHALHEEAAVLFWHLVSLLSWIFSDPQGGVYLSALSISCPKSLMRIGTMLFLFRRRRENPLAKGTAEHFLPFQSRCIIGKVNQPYIALGLRLTVPPLFRLDISIDAPSRRCMVDHTWSGFFCNSTFIYCFVCALIYNSSFINVMVMFKP